MAKHTGGCRCGAIRFEADADPIYASYCHCEDCKRASGAPMAAFVGFHAADVTFDGEDAATYGKAPVSRSFCATCGAPLAYADARLPERIFFMLGAMDAPENYPPTVHAYAPEALPFLHMDDGLPRSDTMTVPRPDGDKT
ncbi:GFA family protein [Rhizobium halophytocola]|uniref:CENP-V/GFA domain-containing protein n=1 Tax=Rhizobium halophytocola TaxID=735519 RepID=A0ABS4DZY0_9HYPH|nr:GFA family protein [Rhizobium halophytocola]MBP1851245.1 hypothetical protein [Rhizobium halophytocola]